MRVDGDILSWLDAHADVAEQRGVSADLVIHWLVSFAWSGRRRGRRQRWRLRGAEHRGVASRRGDGAERGTGGGESDVEAGGDGGDRGGAPSVIGGGYCLGDERGKGEALAGADDRCAFDEADRAGSDSRNSQTAGGDEQ